MATYTACADKRDTKNGMTPNKAIKRPPAASAKKPMKNMGSKRGR